MRFSYAVVLTSAVFTASCAVGPDFHRPPPPKTDDYDSPQPKPAASAGETRQNVNLGQAISAQWWELFRAPALDETVRLALANNYTLAAAKATLAQTRESIIVAQAPLFPQVNASAAASRSGTADGVSGNLFSLGSTVSYAIDIFGGTRRNLEEATASAENQKYQLAAAYLTLTGNCVSEVMTLASTEAEIATTHELIDDDKKNLALVRREYDVGKAAQTDILTAESQLTGDETQLPSLEQQLSVARHALALLVGRSSAEWSPPDFNVEQFTLPQDVPESLPSTLVRQRPDILAAEAQLHVSSAAIGVATAQLYPSLTLSAGVTQDSRSLSTFFQPYNTAWSLGAGVAAPLFRGGALQAQKRAAIDAYNAQMANYAQTVLQAFDQVADTLRALEHDAQLLQAEHTALNTATASLNLQRGSYVAGKSTVLQLIDAQRTLSQARLGYVNAAVQRLQDTAKLFVAMGGGWWDAKDLAPSP